MLAEFAVNNSARFLPVMFALDFLVSHFIEWNKRLCKNLNSTTEQATLYHPLHRALLVSCFSVSGCRDGHQYAKEGKIRRFQFAKNSVFNQRRECPVKEFNKKALSWDQALRLRPNSLSFTESGSSRRKCRTAPTKPYWTASQMLLPRCDCEEAKKA